MSSVGTLKVACFQSQFGKDTKELHGSFLFARLRKVLANTPMVLYALLICSGEDYPRTDMTGSIGGAKKRIRQLLLEYLFVGEARRRRRREGRGFLHMCITNIGGRIFQPTRVYRVTFTKAQVSGSMATGSEEGEGEGRMNRREERQKAGEKSTRARFLCHKVAVRTEFLPSTMHWQQRMLPVFPPLWVCLHVEVCRDVPVVAIQRGQFLSFLFSGVSPANVNT